MRRGTASSGTPASLGRPPPRGARIVAPLGAGWGPFVASGHKNTAAVGAHYAMMARTCARRASARSLPRRSVWPLNRRKVGV
jgi:hypothetical protein